MSMDLSRDMEKLVEERCGWLVARLFLWSTVLGGISVGLGAFGLIVRWVYRNVSPMLSNPSALSLSSATNALISFALTLGLVGGLAYLFYRRERRMIKVLDSFFKKAVFPRIEHIETNAPGLASVREGFVDLNERIKKLEPNPYLQQEIMLKLLSGPRPITAVGKCEPSEE